MTFGILHEMSRGDLDELIYFQNVRSRDHEVFYAKFLGAISIGKKRERDLDETIDENDIFKTRRAQETSHALLHFVARGDLNENGS